MDYLERVGFSLGLELRSGLLSTVWESPLRVVRRSAVIFFTFYWGYGFPPFVSRRIVHEDKHFNTIYINEDVTLSHPHSLCRLVESEDPPKYFSQSVLVDILCSRWNKSYELVCYLIMHLVCKWVNLLKFRMLYSA